MSKITVSMYPSKSKKEYKMIEAFGGSLNLGLFTLNSP